MVIAKATAANWCHKGSLQKNKLKSLKVAKSKDDDGGVFDGSVDASDVNGVLMLCVMVHVMVCVMVYMMVCGCCV